MRQQDNFVIHDETPEWELWNVAARILDHVRLQVGDLFQNLAINCIYSDQETEDKLLEIFGLSSSIYGTIHFVTKSQSNKEFDDKLRFLAYLNSLGYKYRFELSENSSTTPNPFLEHQHKYMRSFQIRLTQHVAL